MAAVGKAAGAGDAAAADTGMAIVMVAMVAVVIAVTAIEVAVGAMTAIEIAVGAMVVVGVNVAYFGWLYRFENCSFDKHFYYILLRNVRLFNRRTFHIINW